MAGRAIREAPDHPRGRLADEADRHAGRQPGRQVGGGAGHRAGVRREGPGQRPVDRPDRRQRRRPGASLDQGRRERRGVEPRRHAARLLDAAGRRRDGRRSTCSTSASPASRSGSPTCRPARACRSGGPTGRRSSSTATSTRARPPTRRTRRRRQTARPASGTRASTTAFPVRDWDRWLDDRRPSLLMQELAPGAAARDILATAVVARRCRPAREEGRPPRDAAGLRRPDGQRQREHRRGMGAGRLGHRVHGDREPQRGGFRRRRPDAVDARPGDGQRAAGAAAAVVQRPRLERRARAGRSSRRSSR